MSVLVLINGAPGSGKSTIASRLAQSRPMALALDIDAIKHNLGFWDVDPIASGLQARALATAMTEQHLSDGYDVVIGQYLARPDFIEALDALAARCSTSFIETVLCLDVKTLRARLESRRLHPDRPEHAVNNLLAPPEKAEEYIASLQGVLAARPSLVAIDADLSIGQVTATIERLLPAT